MAVATVREYGLFINGESAEPASGELCDLVEPATSGECGGEGEVKDWNRRVAEVVDGSHLAFGTKMSLEIYNDPFLGVLGSTSPKRLGEVLENNFEMLYRLDTVGH